MKTLINFYAVTLLILGTGCGSSNKSVPVTGTITLGSTPLPSGVIRFAAPNAPPVAATIQDGKYSTQIEPGKYTVTVEANSGTMTATGSSDDRTRGQVKLPKVADKYRVTGVQVEITEANRTFDLNVSQ